MQWESYMFGEPNPSPKPTRKQQVIQQRLYFRSFGYRRTRR